MTLSAAPGRPDYVRADGSLPSNNPRKIRITGQSRTGMSVLAEQMVLEDLRHGRHLLVLDPHGDFLELDIGSSEHAQPSG